MDAQEIKTVDRRQRLVGYDEVNNAVVSLSCKECLCSEAEKAGDKVMTDFRNVVEREQADDGTMELIDTFERLRKF